MSSPKTNLTLFFPFRQRHREQQQHRLRRPATLDPEHDGQAEYSIRPGYERGRRSQGVV